MFIDTSENFYDVDGKAVWKDEWFDSFETLEMDDVGAATCAEGPSLVCDGQEIFAESSTIELVSDPATGAVSKKTVSRSPITAQIEPVYAEPTFVHEFYLEPIPCERAPLSPADVNKHIENSNVAYVSRSCTEMCTPDTCVIKGYKPAF